MASLLLGMNVMMGIACWNNTAHLMTARMQTGAKDKVAPPRADFLQQVPPPHTHFLVIFP